MSSPWIGLRILEHDGSGKSSSVDEGELALRIPCSGGSLMFYTIDRVKKIYTSISNLPELTSTITILDGPIAYKQGTALGTCNICGERGQNTTYIRFHQDISNNVETWIHEDCCEEFLKLIEEEMEKHSNELVADYL